QLLETCLGSATAGFASRVICHPLDTLKARLQGPQGDCFRNTLHVLRVSMAEEGLRGLYRGFGAVAVGGTPGTCLYLTTYEFTKNLLWRENGQENFAVHFTAGMLAEIVCCVVYVPVDVVKGRLQIQRPVVNSVSVRVLPAAGPHAGEGLPTYKGSLHALQTILRMEGLRGVYKGYGATLLSFGPFSALYFMFYEQAKSKTLD
ncbi:unnamed protein product, partial [Choristocarpus tenellus]